jgi:hypothetical protein
MRQITDKKSRGQIKKTKVRGLNIAPVAKGLEMYLL